MLLLLNGLLSLHFGAFLMYLTTLLQQWSRPTKRTNTLMLYCGITLLLTGIALVAIRFPMVIYWEVVLKAM